MNKDKPTYHAEILVQCTQRLIDAIREHNNQKQTPTERSALYNHIYRLIEITKTHLDHIAETLPPF